MSGDRELAMTPEEIAWELGGWADLLDTPEPCEAELAYRQQVAWEAQQETRREAQEAAAQRRPLLDAVSRLPAPDRDVLRARVSTSLDTDVLAVLLGLDVPEFQARLTAAVAAVPAATLGEVLAVLPEPARHAISAIAVDIDQEVA